MNSDDSIELCFKPRLLLLHGGGSTADIFRSQCRTFVPFLTPFFRLVFVDGPFFCEPGPGVDPVYSSYGPPFRRWLRWKPEEHAEIPDDAARAELQYALFHGMLSDDCAGGRGPWIGAMGFSQGAKMAASLVYDLQVWRDKVAKGEELSRFEDAEEHKYPSGRPRYPLEAQLAAASVASREGYDVVVDWRFCVIMNGRPPLACLSDITGNIHGLQKAGELLDEYTLIDKYLGKDLDPFDHAGAAGATANTAADSPFPPTPGSDVLSHPGLCCAPGDCLRHRIAAAAAAATTLKYQAAPAFTKTLSSSSLYSDLDGAADSPRRAASPRTVTVRRPGHQARTAHFITSQFPGNRDGTLTPASPTPVGAGGTLISVPTVHVHGLLDPGLKLHEGMVREHCVPGTATVVQWEGDHRVPVRKSEVRRIADVILEVAAQTGALTMSGDRNYW